MRQRQNHTLEGLVFTGISSVVLLPLILPFFKPGRQWTYDVDYHQYRMVAFHRTFVEGNIPPRWSSQLVYGWGSSIFNFNWSLPYWMAEPFLFAGWSVTDASKAVVILTVVLSYLAMFVFLRAWLGFWPSLAGSAVYEWSLFRIYLLFTGGSLGMHAAFIFWPVLFWAALVIRRKPTLAFICISVGTALLMLSHQVMFLLIQPLYWAFVWLTSGHDAGKKQLSLIVLAFIAGLGLSAYFWLPAFLEQQFIHIDMTATLYKNNFLDLATIFHEPGITDRTPPLQYWYWSTGWILFLIELVATLLIIREKKLRIMWLFAAFFLIGQLFTTKVSAVIWDTMPLLKNFIYPVRFQALSLFCGSILGAYLIYRTRRGMSWIFALCLVAVTVGINALAIPTTWPREVITDAYYEQGDSTVDMMGEYLPQWANVNHFFATPDRFERHPIARIADGSGTIDTMVKRQSNAMFTVRADTEVSVIINQLYFPGWSITANSRPVSFVPYGYGEMLIRLPKGVSLVKASFTDTSTRAMGNWITAVTAIFMVFLGVSRLREKRLRPEPP